MRIISGKVKGKRLRSLRGPHIRPPLARVRQIIFSILGGRVKSAEVLDLFAGTGSLGLEALSRGARRAVFVDNSALSVRVLKANIKACGLGEESLPVMLSAFQVFRSRRILEAAPYRIIFADPPYPLLDMTRGLNRFVRLLDRLVEENLLASDGIVVARHRAGILLAGKMRHLEVTHSRRAGDTVVAFLECRTL